jgi:hypothetical protein
MDVTVIIGVADPHHFNADPHHFNADPDPNPDPSSFNLNAHPDPTSHFNADPYPAYQNYANLRPLVYRPSRAPF